VRIVHLVDALDTIGGVPTYLGGLLPALASRGVENTVLTGASGGTAPGAEVVHVPAIEAATAAVSAVLADELRVALRRANPDIVYSHTARSPAVVAVAAEVAPVAVYAHDYFTICPGSERYLHRSVAFCSEGFGARCFWRAYTERTTNRRPDRLVREIRRVARWQHTWQQVAAVLVASPFVADTYRAAGIPADRIKLVPYSVEMPPQIERDKDVDVAYIGRLTDSKGVHVLLEAISDLEEVTLTIAGDGPERIALEAQVVKLGLESRVRFVGWIQSDERDDLLARSRVFAMPALWDEPFGIVGVEALAAGVPVVATDVGGIPSWLDDQETGLLVPRGDRVAFADALRRLLSDGELRSRMGTLARTAANRFSLVAHVDALLDAFADLRR
jgi:glycosyltransferase involved in cell wall biosynthesis